MIQQLLVSRIANGTKNTVCRILLTLLVLGTLIATCYRVLLLQRSIPSNHIITHDIVLISSSTKEVPLHTSNSSVIQTASATITTTDAKAVAKMNHTAMAPLHIPNSSVTPRAAAVSATLTVPTPNTKTDARKNKTTLASLNSSVGHQQAASNTSCIAPFSSSNSRIPKRHIFVDFGANDAHSVELFINSSTIYWNEIESYSKRVANLRRSNITGVMLGWEVHVFEANPSSVLVKKMKAQRLHMISNNLTQSYHLYDSTAITTHDGFIEFILDNNKTGSSGSTTMNESASAVGTKVNVTAVDIVTFLKNLQIREMDEVVIKMDVEGAEYALCRRMIAYCLFPLIDRIAIEWHHHNQFVLGHHGDKYEKEHKDILQALTERGWQHKLLEWA